MKPTAVENTVKEICDPLQTNYFCSLQSFAERPGRQNKCFLLSVSKNHRSPTHQVSSVPD